MRHKVAFYLSKIESTIGRRILVVRGNRYKSLDGGTVRQAYYVGFIPGLVVEISHKEVQ